MKAEDLASNFRVGVYTGLTQNDGTLKIIDYGILDLENCTTQGCSVDQRGMMHFSTQLGQDFVALNLIPKNTSQPMEASITYRLIDLNENAFVL